MLFSKLIVEPKSYVSKWLRNARFQSKFPGVTLEFPTKILFDQLDAIEIGQDVHIGPYSEMIIQKVSPSSNISGKLCIGNRVVVGAWSNIRAAGGEIFIGENTLIAQNVSLIAANHMLLSNLPYRDLNWSEDKVGIFIEENVWIGAGSTVLPGTRIGKNSVIGAGSVLTKNIPPNEIWAGVPARKIRCLP